eukprot:4813098-Prymnesium_polylepis.1
MSRRRGRADPVPPPSAAVLVACLSELPLRRSPSRPFDDSRSFDDIQPRARESAGCASPFGRSPSGQRSHVTSVRATTHAHNASMTVLQPTMTKAT